MLMNFSSYDYKCSVCGAKLESEICKVCLSYNPQILEAFLEEEREKELINLNEE